MKNKKKLIILTIIILLLAAGVSWIIYKNTFKNNSGNFNTKSEIETLAKCLRANGAVMYGAYWCPHCQSQKKMFGGSFKYINYVECTKDIKKCEEKKIDGYPTWIFKDGKRAKGEISFADLAEKSACRISGSAQTKSNTIAYSAKSKLESVQKVKEISDKNEKTILLDVRTADEYQSGRLENSISLPLDEIAAKAEIALKDKKAQIIVYCRSGGRSKKAVEILLSKGYMNVIDMQGGIIAWQNAGFTVVKD